MRCGTIKYQVSKWHAHVRTEEIEELLLARMRPVLEHSSFCVCFRIEPLEQNLGLVIACQPRAAVRGEIARNEVANGKHCVMMGRRSNPSVTQPGFQTAG